MAIRAAITRRNRVQDSPAGPHGADSARQARLPWPKLLARTVERLDADANRRSGPVRPSRRRYLFSSAEATWLRENGIYFRYRGR